MGNLLRVVSTANVSTTTTLDLETYLGEKSSMAFELPAGGLYDVYITDDPALTFPGNRYGIMNVETDKSSQAVMDMLRYRFKFQNGYQKFDFVLPTLVQ
jgi:hypothetical protein